MLKKWLKRAFWFGLVLMVLLGIAIGVLYATFDPNAYKSNLIDWVKTHKHRTLSLPGPLKLSVFPNIALTVNGASLSEYETDTRFASLTALRVGVALMPLFKNQIKVTSVDINQLRVNISKDKSGKFNFADLLQQEAGATPSTQTLSLDIAKIALTDSNIDYADASTGQQAKLDHVNVNATDINPERGAKGNFSATFTHKQLPAPLDLKFSLDAAKDGEKMRVDLSSFALKMGDQLASGKLRGTLLPHAFEADEIAFDVTGSNSGNTSKLKFTAPQLHFAWGDALNLQLPQATFTGGNEGPSGTGNFTLVLMQLGATPTQITLAHSLFNANYAGKGSTAKVTLDATALDASNALITGKKLVLTTHATQDGQTVSNTLTGSFKVIPRTLTVTLPQLSLVGKATLPGMHPFNWQLAGMLEAGIHKQTVSTQLKGKLDASQLTFAGTINNFKTPHFTLKIGLDALDLARYLPTSTAASNTQKSTGPEFQLPDLPLFKQLNGTADIHIGTLQKAPWVAKDVSLHFDATPGNWKINPYKLSLADGQFNGQLDAHWSGVPHFAVIQKVSGVSVGKMLINAIGKDTLTGTGHLDANLTLSGRTLSQLLASLNGTNNVKIENGALKGISLIETVQKAQISINSLREKHDKSAGATGKTEFSDMSASFHIKNGLATNTDLKMVAPLMSATGQGQFNLPKQTIDYALLGGIEYKKGQGAAAGVEVPVKIAGTFSAPTYTVDYGKMLQSLLKQKASLDAAALLDKEALKKKVDTGLKESLKKEGTNLKDKLKGLFGK